MSKRKKITVPKSTIIDDFHTITQGMIGAVPVGGSPLASVFSIAVSKPIKRKLDNFYEELAEDIYRLSSDVESLKKIMDDDRLPPAVIQGVGIALETTDANKLQAARNTVINSIKLSPEENKRLRFMSALRDITPLHIDVLNFFRDPYKFEAKKHNYGDIPWGDTVTILVRDVFNDYNDEYLNIIIKDLQDHGLVNQNRNSITLNSEGSYLDILTEHGKEFMDFISRPS